MQLPAFIPAISPRQIKAKDTPLRPSFQPGQYDVICQRGKEAYRHMGNRRFRIMIDSNVEQYATAATKVDKSLLVISIVDTIRKLAPGGGFVRFCKKKGCYVEIGDNLAREKVGHALREVMHGKKKSSSSSRGDSQQKALDTINKNRAAAATKKRSLAGDASAFTFQQPDVAVSSTSCCTEPLSFASLQEQQQLRQHHHHQSMMPLLDAFASDIAKQNQMREPTPIEETHQSLALFADIFEHSQEQEQQEQEQQQQQQSLTATTTPMDSESLFRNIDLATYSTAPLDEEEQRSLRNDLKEFNLFQI